MTLAVSVLLVVGVILAPLVVIGAVLLKFDAWRRRRRSARRRRRRAGYLGGAS